MILALETGWTDRQIARLAGPFRAACHHVLYIRQLIGEDGLPDIDLSALPLAQKAEAAKRKVAISNLRKQLDLDDADE